MCWVVCGGIIKDLLIIVCEKLEKYWLKKFSVGDMVNDKDMGWIKILVSIYFVVVIIM